jgi:hypothetical protein
VDREAPSLWYIDAMMLKGLAVFAVFLAVSPVLLFAQTNSQPNAAATQRQPQTKQPPDCNGAPCEDQQPHLIVTLPAPAPVQWPLHDRILWGALLAMVFIAYAGVMLAVSTLKKIERHTGATEASVVSLTAAATAANETAQASLLHAQSMLKAERPWVLVTAEATRGVENSFDITATNRGRSPATITSALDQVVFASDEPHLPAVPAFKLTDSKSRFVPLILLPGESATLKSFTREQVKEFCGSDERFAAVENWSERLFLCGKIVYKDLVAPAGKELHETNWCCWYIHGKQRSALVPAGPAEYNAHT